VPVEDGDTPESLAERVLKVEHRLYPRVVRWFASGRAHLRNGHVELDGEPIKAPVRVQPD
jgi:phosphoribosylglycinamide formyltransferase-1